jgi:hypothetical protein
MNKKNVFAIIGLLAIVASVVMYWMGKNSSHLTELRNFWWYPLPLAVVCFLIAGTKKKEQ